MPVSHPLAIKFCNEDVRPTAETFARLYYNCKSFQDFWNTNNAGAIFAAGAGLVEDNATEDGRTPITSDDVRAFKAWVDAFLASLNANADANLKAVVKPSVRVK